MKLTHGEYNLVLEAIEHYKSHFSVQELHSYYYDKIKYDKRKTGSKVPSDYQFKKILRMEGYKNVGRGVYIKNDINR